MNLVSSRLAQTARAYGDVVRNPSYAPLWLGQLLSNFGDTLHYIVLVVLVFQLTGEGIAVAGLVAAEIVPLLLLGPIAGVLIDRLSRKAVLVGADLFRAVLVLSLVWPQAPGTHTPWPLDWLPATHSSIRRFRQSFPC